MTVSATRSFRQYARAALKPHGFSNCAGFAVKDLSPDLRLTISFPTAIRSSTLSVFPVLGINCDRINDAWSALRHPDPPVSRCFPLLTLNLPVNDEGGVVFFVPKTDPMKQSAQELVDRILWRAERLGARFSTIADVIKGIEAGWSRYPEYHLPIALRLVGDERRAREIVVSHLAAIPRHVDPATYREFGRRFLESGTTPTS